MSRYWGSGVQFHEYLTLLIDVRKYLASRPGRFIHNRKIDSGTNRKENGQTIDQVRRERESERGH
jgi:hypothetical protein